MKVAFVTTDDPNDVRAWSGTYHFAAKALAAQAVDVDPIGPLAMEYEKLFKAKEGVYRYLFRRRHPRDREPFVARRYARQVEHRLRPEHDLVFSVGTLPLPYLECEQPIVAWSDATFASLIDFYPVYSNLAAESVRLGNELESQALRRCQRVIYSSEWAARSAVADYGIDAERIAVVPFGANLDTEPNDDVDAFVDRRNTDPCRLLFVGVEWERKGGDVAVDVVTLLNAAGLRAELDVVGPGPSDRRIPSFVNLHGYVDKSSANGRRVLGELFARSHFFVLPTRADCTPIVLNEAAAHAVPVLATSVGGIPTIVRDGANGMLFALDAPASAYSDYVLDVLSEKGRYRELALSSFDEYRKRLNWTAAGAEVRRLLDDVLATA